MHLSKHFTLYELTRSQLATRFGINNQPNRKELSALSHLCEHILEPVRHHFGVPFSPSSGYRCHALNQRLGSGDNSQHIKGQAVDFEIAGLSNLAVAHWIKDHLVFDQLILEYYDPSLGANSGWIHVSLKKLGNRQQVLTQTEAGIRENLPSLKAGETS